MLSIAWISPGFGHGRGRSFSALSGMQRSVHSVTHGNGNMPLTNPPLTSSTVPQSFPPSQPTQGSTSTLLSVDQCHQLISYLQSQIQGQTLVGDHVQSAASSTSSNDFGPSFSGMFSLTPFIG